jgi:hypothetical protein
MPPKPEASGLGFAGSSRWSGPLPLAARWDSRDDCVGPLILAPVIPSPPTWRTEMAAPARTCKLGPFLIQMPASCCALKEAAPAGKSLGSPKCVPRGGNGRKRHTRYNSGISGRFPQVRRIRCPRS